MPIVNISQSTVAPSVSSNPLAIGSGNSKWYDNSGVLEATNNAENALVKVRVLTPAGATDATTKAYVDALSGTSATSFQIDNDNTGPLLKNNSGVLQARNAADDAMVTVEVDTPTTSGHATTKGYVDSLSGTSATSFQIDNDNTGPKLKNNAGVLQARNAADDAMVTVEVDTPTTSGHAATKGYVDAITGTSAGTWQLDNDNTGPKLKNNSGVLEVRNDADDAFLIVRGLTPVGTTDLTTKAYVDGKIATYTSGSQTIGAGTTDTLAHGLSGVPQVIQVTLVNDSDEAGYVAGDVIDLTSSLSAASNRGIQVQVDATNIILVYGSDAQSISILNKGTGALTAITNAQWHIVVKAIYFS